MMRDPSKPILITSNTPLSHSKHKINIYSAAGIHLQSIQVRSFSLFHSHPPTHPLLTPLSLSLLSLNVVGFTYQDHTIRMDLSRTTSNPNSRRYLSTLSPPTLDFLLRTILHSTLDFLSLFRLGRSQRTGSENLCRRNGRLDESITVCRDQELDE